MTFNANGIHRDHLNLQELLYRKNIDIALIQETKLPAGFNWKSPRYRTYNTQGPNHPHGGTAILIKSTIQHTQIPLNNLKKLAGNWS